MLPPSLAGHTVSIISPLASHPEHRDTFLTSYQGCRVAQRWLERLECGRGRVG